MKRPSAVGGAGAKQRKHLKTVEGAAPANNRRHQAFVTIIESTLLVYPSIETESGILCPSSPPPPVPRVPAFGLGFRLGFAGLRLGLGLGLGLGAAWAGAEPRRIMPAV